MRLSIFQTRVTDHMTCTGNVSAGQCLWRLSLFDGTMRRESWHVVHTPAARTTVNVHTKQAACDAKRLRPSEDSASAYSSGPTFGWHHVGRWAP